MCGRYAVFASLREICRRFGALPPDETQAQGWKPLYNAAPMMDVPIIIRGQMGFARWGFVPTWAKDEQNAAKLINARSETIAEKPTFKDAWIKRRRCLIPANGFYEWKKQGADQGAYFIGPDYDVPHGTEDMINGNVVFGFAGLWEVWNDRVGFTILTRPARPSLEHIHAREPVIFSPQQADLWFNSDYGGAQTMMEEQTHEAIRFWRVGPDVGSVKNNDPALLKPDHQSSVLL